MIEQLGIAIIGSGYWGINYVRVFNELPQTKLIAVCDPDSQRREEVKRRFPSVNLFKDVSDVWQHDEVDAVVIATPATTHYEIARDCLMAGKHVLVEKPITLTTEHALNLIDLAKVNNVTLMVGHIFLFNAGVKKIKSWLDNDAAGRVYYLYARRTNLGPIRHDVNALWDLAPHDISIFNYFLNDTPKWVSAVASKVLENSRADVGFISLGYANNITCNIHVSWVDPNKVREIVVVGSEKRIVFDDINMLERVKIFEKGIVPAAVEATTFGEYHFQIRDGDIISPRIGVSEPLKDQCLHFLDCVVNGRKPRTDGWDGLNVVKVMEAIDQSIAQNGKPITLEQTERSQQYATP